MKHSLGIISSLFLTWLIWGPIIINSQPGTTWILFGIDWKADNLDNTMFWIGIILGGLCGVAAGYNERKKEEIEARDLR